MPKKKPIALVAEDNEINRELLSYILKDDFNIIEAVDGKEAMDCIEQMHQSITIILLDIVMPRFDGYDVLEFMKEHDYGHIPVLVMTGDHNEQSEEKALNLGAWDFVTKPYKPNVLMTRIKNAIARSKMNYIKEIEHQAQHDALTGLYNRGYFFKETNQMIEEHKGELFTFLRLDIKQFALINSFWGEEGGNALLKFIANMLDTICSSFELCSYGRIESDVFCMVVLESREKCLSLIHDVQNTLAGYRTDYIVEPAFGIYEMKKGQDFCAEDMYLRATVAAKACKNNALMFYNDYDDENEKNILLEKEIVHDMQYALEHDQFCVYFQPKFNASTKTPYGAEALARWIHPEKGLISPGEFIPIFEKNGFIGKLDFYIWEKTCQYIRRWIDMGIKTAPVSINISRSEISNPNLVDDLVGLVSKYEIPTYLLQLELTESAYMDHPELINGMIDKLHTAGFVVMMDDFGSGYSSLNTLKDIEVDMLKIDMKFLSEEGEKVKGKRILTSVVCMARWIGLPVITEGVETKEQFEFLQNIGCEYIQGFYFAKPMPADEYEELIKKVILVNAESNDVSHADLFLPKTLRDRIYKDKITGAYNKRYLKEWLFLDMDDITDDHMPLAIIMMKLIDFEKYIITYGERFGERILQKTYSVISGFIRKNDEVIRYDEDKFTIILPGCSEEIAMKKVAAIQTELLEIGKQGVDFDFKGAWFGCAFTESFKKDNQFLKDMIDNADHRLGGN